MKMDFNFVLTLLLAGALIMSGSFAPGIFGSMLTVFGALVIVYEMIRVIKKRSR